MLRSSTDPDGRRLVRAAVLTGVIYGLVGLFLFLAPNRVVNVSLRGSAALAGSSYRSVRLSLAGSDPAGVATGSAVIVSAGRTRDGSDVSGFRPSELVAHDAAGSDPAVAGKPSPHAVDAVQKPFRFAAEIGNDRKIAAGPVRDSVRDVSPELPVSGLPVADPGITDSRPDSVHGSAVVVADGDLSRHAGASTTGTDRAIGGSDVTLSQEVGSSRSGMDSSVAGGVSSPASGSSASAPGGTPGNAAGYTFSGNGVLPDGVRGSGRFSTWIDGAIRKRLTYPERARRRNLQGAVILALSVPADGSRCEASVLESSGSPILDAAALTLLKSLFPAPVPPDKAFYSPVKIQYLIIQD